MKASRKEGEIQRSVGKTLYAYLRNMKRNDLFFDQEVIYNVSHEY